METVSVQHDFAAPVERVYDYLAEHENLRIVFRPARIVRVRDGHGDRNGVGSVRRLSFGGMLPFEETVTDAVPNELIEYRITKGTPIRDHLGVMRFSETPAGGTHLDYTINLDARVPGLAAAVAAVLRRQIARGLRRVDAALPA